MWQPLFKETKRLYISVSLIYMVIQMPYGVKQLKRAELNRQRRGKTYEEIYGEKRGKELKEKLRKISPRGDKHFRWTGGSYDWYHKEARKIMENHIGRKLKTKESVHHKDGDYTNNQIENLVILQKKEHHKHHTRLRNRNKRGEFK